jgi:uncharacterized protein YfbU (UPF0304 family)
MEITTLTPAERLILANQYRAEGDTYRAQILERGYTGLYRDIFDAVSEELPIDQCNFVEDVMAMYWTLQLSYDNLEDKSGVDASDVAFPGFDGNHETSMMAYSRAVKSNDRFDSLRVSSTDHNSHSPKVARYQEMLARLQASENPHEPTAEDIKRIVKRG